MTIGALLPLALAAAPGCAARAPQDAAGDSTAVYQASGVNVIHRATPAGDLVAVRLYLLGGTRQLSPATAGIEALLLRAAELDARRALARTGAGTTLEPDVDWTATGFVALKEDVEPAWAAFSRWITEPAAGGSLSDAAIARARAELSSAARRRYSHPDLRLETLAAHLLFAEHSYGLDPEGTERSLGALQRADLERYGREQFVTSRMLLVVVGDVPRARVESLVGATLGRLPRGDYRWTLPAAVPRQKSGRVVREHRSLPTNYILGYFAGPTPQERDYTAFWVATQLLSSRLHRIIRNERSLSYVAGARFLDRAIPVGGVYASTSKPAEVYPLMLRAVSELQGTLVDGWALSRFLDQFTIDRLAQQLTAEGQAESLGRAYLYHGDHRVAGQHVSRLRRVSAEQVRRAAAQYMQHIQFAYLGDTTPMRGKW